MTFRTTDPRRGRSRLVLPLVLCALLLVGCGFIEGYLSPDPDFPMLNRVVVGFGYGIVMIGALTGHLFGRSRASRSSNDRSMRSSMTPK